MGIRSQRLRSSTNGGLNCSKLYEIVGDLLGIDPGVGRLGFLQGLVLQIEAVEGLRGALGGVPETWGGRGVPNS